MAKLTLPVHTKFERYKGFVMIIEPLSSSDTNEFVGYAQEEGDHRTDEDGNTKIVEFKNCVKGSRHECGKELKSFIDAYRAATANRQKLIVSA